MNKLTKTAAENRLTSSWKIGAAILFFAILTLILLNKSLLPGYTLVPLDILKIVAPWDYLEFGPRANRLLIDPFFIYFPNRHLLTESLQAGHFPLWNPYLFTGTPTIADPNFQPFYIPNLLAALFLPVAQALPWLAFFHLTMTGTLMFLFFRRHQLHGLAAVLGGSIWLLNGYGLVWLENPHRWSTACWIPGIFWAYEAAAQERKFSWAALGGLFLGIAILGGQVQFVYMTGLMLGIYAVVKMILNRQRDWKTPLISLLIIGLVGLGLGALLLLPAAEFSAYSHRTSFDRETILQTQWPVSHLITLMAPDFFGNPSTPVRYWGAINYAETAVYFGVVAFFLALTAVVFARRTHFFIYAGVLTAVVLAITLGTPLVRLLFLLPGSQFVVLNRTIFLIPLVGAWLAAAALDGWLTRSLSLRQKILAVGGSLTLMVMMAGWVIYQLGDTFLLHQAEALVDLRRSALLTGTAVILLLSWRSRWVGSLIVLLVVFDLLQWGIGFNPIFATEYLYPDNDVVARLRQEQEEALFRVVPLQEGYPLLFGPNILSLFGIEDIIGYSSLIRKEYAEFIEAMDDDVLIDWMAANENILVMSHVDPLLSLINVKYVLSVPGLTEPPPWLEHRETIDGVHLYENTAVAPRAFLVHQVEQLPAASTLGRLQEPDFDWRHTALVNKNLPVVQQSQLASEPQVSQADVTMVEYQWQRVTLDVDTPLPGFLVLSDAFYPGWQATIDGEPTEIYQTNHMMRGVFVAEGSHRVQFSFFPATLRWGLVLMGLALTAVIMIVGYEWRTAVRTNG
ncbi:MAG: hypothetical protein CSB13_00580 [Chloroflexi bacterium]|nr:MAG: hypothetical protein CSB13_00580 [Chloroflexota bacterium]